MAVSNHINKYLNFLAINEKILQAKAIDTRKRKAIVKSFVKLQDS